MKIRVASREDVKDLVALSRETFTETFGEGYPLRDLATFLDSTYTVENYTTLVERPDTRVWVAIDAGRASGYVVAGPCSLPHDEVEDGDGEIKRLYVRSSYQGGGRGSALFEKALSWLEESGPRTLWLGVWSENYGAQQLYERYGFTHVGSYSFIVGQTRDHEYIYRKSPSPLALEQG